MDRAFVEVADGRELHAAVGGRVQRAQRHGDGTDPGHREPPGDPLSVVGEEQANPGALARARMQ